MALGVLDGGFGWGGGWGDGPKLVGSEGIAEASSPFFNLEGICKYEPIMAIREVWVIGWDLASDSGWGEVGGLASGDKSFDDG